MDLPEVAPNARDRACLATCINLGPREEEVKYLKIGDVDLHEGLLRVVVKKTAEIDLMPISLDLDREIRRWLAAYAEALGHPLAARMYLFPANSGPRWDYVVGPDGRKEKVTVPGRWNPWNPVASPAQIVQCALQSLGYPTKQQGTHTVRRSVARAFFDSLADEGYDSALRATSALLHHQDSRSTELYLGLGKEKLKRDDTIRGKPFLSEMVRRERQQSLRKA